MKKSYRMAVQAARRYGRKAALVAGAVAVSAVPAFADGDPLSVISTGITGFSTSVGAIAAGGLAVTLIFVGWSLAKRAGKKVG